VEGCEEVHVDLEGRPGAARVVARDEKNDLALLATDLHPVQGTNWRLSVRQGEDIVVYGFPLTGVLASGGNVVTGNVSALAGIGNDSRFLQISAPIQPGNSGGPLLDRNGNVVGIVVAKLNALGIASATGDIPQNVNFAIKASVATAFLDAQSVGHAEREGATALSTSDIAARAKALTMQVACIATRPKPLGAPPKSVTTPVPRAVPEKTLLTIDTRFGRLAVIKDAENCCKGKINYGAQKIELASAGELYAD
jgi:serine protease Do